MEGVNRYYHHSADGGAESKQPLEVPSDQSREDVKAVDSMSEIQTFSIDKILKERKQNPFGKHSGNGGFGDLK